MNEYSEEVLDFTVNVGTVLLESGAEIRRVEDTMQRISAWYGVKDISPFVLSTGIFLTAKDSDRDVYANVRHIPFRAVHINRIIAVNALSRQIAAGKYSLPEAVKELKGIQEIPDKNFFVQGILAGVGSGGFCYTFGGVWTDCLASVISGMLVSFFVSLSFVFVKKPSKILVHILGAFLAVLCSTLLFRVGLGENVGMITSGAIMPLIPGTSFINGVRELTNGDYIAGTIRLVDALLVTFCIALGVALFYVFF